MIFQPPTSIPTWAEFNARWTCAHVDEAARIRTLSNGSTTYWWQCTRCGSGRPIKRIERQSVASVSAWDDQIADRWYQDRQAEAQELSQQRRTVERESWFEEHSEYLRSAAWKAKRVRVLARDKYRCQAGLIGCTVEASQVHHLTYAHWRNEPLFDLIAVCQECHIQITRMDREGRSAA
jgi:hypothetical protein